MFLPSFPKLFPSEKKIFRLHLQYSLFEGIAGGLILSHAYVLKKGLLATASDLALLQQLVTITLLTALLANEVTRRVKNISKITILTGFISRLGLLGIVFVPQGIHSNFGITIFVIAFGLFFLSVPFNGPILNLITKHAYRPELFGPLYSTASVIRMSATLFFAITIGIMLDIYPGCFRIFYPLAGILGLIGTLSIARMPYEQKVSPHEIKRTELKYKNIPSLPLLKDMLIGAIRGLTILKENTRFRDFQISMMLYGISILSTVAFVQIIFDDSLNLNYLSTNAYNAVQQFILLLSLPLCGIFIGKIDPRKFAIICYFLFAVHIFLIMISPLFGTYCTLFDFMICIPLLIAYIIGGVFLAMMTVLWGIGSAYFCEVKASADYQSTHVALTGVRGFFAPMFGVMIFSLTGSINCVFASSIILLIIAIAYMQYSIKKRPFIVSESHHTTGENIVEIATTARSSVIK